ncbi:MAG: hypothetical protein Kow00108_11210 [Calditrichia bacterium]
MIPNIRRYSLFICILFTFHVSSLQAGQWAFVVPEDSIRQWITNYIKTQIQLNEGEDYQIKSLRCPERIQLPVKNFIRQIKDKNRELRGNVVFSIQLADPSSGKVYKTFTVSARIKRFERVVMAQRRIHKGDTLADSDVSLKVVETTSLRPGYLTDSDQINGKIAIKSIGEKEILYSRFLMNIPIISKGERVVIEYNEPPLRIKVFAIALENGGAGDWIWVKNLESNKRIKVRVIGRGIVRLK